MAQESIFIEFKKDKYLPGEQVNGEVFLNFSQDCHMGDTVHLLISAVEEVKLHEIKAMNEEQWDSRYSPNNRRYDRYYMSQHEWSMNEQAWNQGKVIPPPSPREGEEARPERRRVLLEKYQVSEIIEENVVLQSYEQNGSPNSIPAGQYSIPFSFLIPHLAPASFQYQWNLNSGEHNFAQIQYKVTAFIGSASQKYNPRSYQDKKYCHNSQIMVNSVVVEEELEDKYKNKVNLYCCCCIPRGKIKMKSKFEKSNYQVGETAKVFTKFEVEDSKVDLKQMEGALIRSLVLVADGFTKKFKHSINSVSSDGLKAGTDDDDTKPVEHQIRIIDKNDENKEMNPSTDGAIIDCVYFLNVIMHMDVTCNCSGNPKIKVPVSIRSPDPEPKFFEKPDDWDPFKTQVQILSMRSKFAGLCKLRQAEQVVQKIEPGLDVEDEEVDEHSHDDDEEDEIQQNEEEQLAQGEGQNFVVEPMTNQTGLQVGEHMALKSDRFEEKIANQNQEEGVNNKL